MAKVRIGYGLGTTADASEGFGELVDALEDTGFDSLWMSERLTGPAPDPLIGLAYAAGRTRKLKLGTSVVVVPGRNPVVLAKEVATLAVLSGGRFVPAFGLGVADPGEQQAFGVARKERGAWLEEALPLMRRMWTGEPVDHEGDRFRYEGLRVGPPAGALDVWLGGRAPSELRRVGRLADGWLPSFCTPEEAAAGRVVAEEAAGEAGRAIDPEHWGALVVWSEGPVPAALAAGLARRRPDVDPAAVIPSGFDALRSRLQEFVDRGFTKFVIAPLGGQDPKGIARLGESVLDLQTR